MRPSNDRIANAISSVRIVRRRLRQYQAVPTLDNLTASRLEAWEQQLARVCSMLGDDRELVTDKSFVEGNDGENPF